MWRIEIDYDDRRLTSIPLLTDDEEDARKNYWFWSTYLRIAGVVRLYSPGRVLQEYKRIADAPATLCG